MGPWWAAVPKTPSANISSREVSMRLRGTIETLRELTKSVACTREGVCEAWVQALP